MRPTDPVDAQLNALHHFPLDNQGITPRSRDDVFSRLRGVMSLPDGSYGLFLDEFII